MSRVLKFQQDLLRANPNAPLVHNALAWLLGRTHTDLDQALAHATKAAESCPRSTAILDTLAEVYFQRGETEKAIATIRRCIAIEPESPRHAAALNRFQHSSPDTDPPPEEMF